MVDGYIRIMCLVHCAEFGRYLLPKICAGIAYSLQAPGTDTAAGGIVGMYVTYIVQLSLLNESET